MRHFLLPLLSLLLAHLAFGQNIRFSFTVNQTSASTSEVEIYAQTTTDTEVMAGYTVYFYYDNAEATVTGYDSSPTTTDLGWLANNETFILHQSEANPNVPITHSGYFFYQNIDNSLNGNTFSTTPTLLMRIQFDHMVGGASAGEGYYAGTAEVPPVEYSSGINQGFQGHDVIIIGQQTQALPLELLSFTAQRKAQRSYLQWATAWESGTSHFEVEHSTDARQFRTLGKVIASGQSVSEVNYDYWHEQPITGNNYYRLRMVDLDDSYEYSPVVKLIFDANGEEVLVYPNPTQGLVQVRAASFSLDHLEVRDAMGRLVATLPANTTQVDLSTYPGGLYYLFGRDVAGQELWRERVVKE